jgi:putative transposase
MWRWLVAQVSNLNTVPQVQPSFGLTWAPLAIVTSLTQPYKRYSVFPMPRGLYRNQQSGQSHFVTFSCYRRQPLFNDFEAYDLFPACLEKMRRRFHLCVYGYVIMPEHVHLLLTEPEQGTLAEAIHYLKLSFTKKLHARVSGRQAEGSFWQKRYYDRNVRNAREFTVKLKYLHRNPVKRGLVQKPEDWEWSSFRHYALRESGVVEIESEWTGRDRELRRLGQPARVWLNPG